jgi:hypothetical protein
MRPYRFTVPAASLPADEAARAELLARTFQRRHAAARRCGAGWEITLRTPTSVASFIDPRLAEGLAWWGDGLTAATLPLAVRLDAGFQLALDDGWTLFAWSCRSEAEPVDVLHLDSHADLGSPRLGRDCGSGPDDGWRDLVTGEPVVLAAPESVAAAIASGAVGIGSFFAPYLTAAPATRLVHLAPAGRLPRPAGDYRWSIEHAPDEGVFAGSPRPRVAVEPAPDPAHANLLVHHDLAAALPRLGTRPLYLHVDLDYFNDRYDHRPDWAERDHHDPAPAAVLAAVDDLFACLAAHPAGARVVDVTVALSPGFFPAELWPGAIERVRAGVARLGIAEAA